MSDLFNWMIDLVSEAGFRVLELPFVVLMVLAVIPVALARVLVGVWRRRHPLPEDAPARGSWRPFFLAYVALVAALLVDARLSAVLLELREMRVELTRQANLPAPAAWPALAEADGGGSDPGPGTAPDERESPAAPQIAAPQIAAPQIPAPQIPAAQIPAEPPRGGEVVDGESAGAPPGIPGTESDGRAAAESGSGGAATAQATKRVAAPTRQAVAVSATAPRAAGRPNTAAQTDPGALPTAGETPVQRMARLSHAAPTRVDVPRMRAAVEELFPHSELLVRGEAPGVDYAWVHLNSPHQVHAHLAVIDLTNPQIEIKITEELGRKSLTSEFARLNHCAVAINGEAGVDPTEDGALGQWRGNWIVRGNAVMMDDSDRRPFLSFAASNLARYSRALDVDREVTDWKWNTIWGRSDLLVGGRITARDRGTTPRNCMAIDASGETLYLLVVDGRRPGYSLGLGLVDCARLLRALGASDGMACDQGGSACMFLGSRGGIASRPSDRVGERPVYTHFGVAVKE